MPEIQSKVQPYKIDMECPVCKTGNMRPEGLMLTSMPPQYPHKCDHCGNSEIYSKTYPYISYEAICDDTPLKIK